MDLLKMFLKIMLIFIGGAMLLGGGICVVTNIAFMVPNLPHGEVQLFLVLGGISAAVAAVGWVLIKLSGKITRSDAAPAGTDHADLI